MEGALASLRSAVKAALADRYAGVDGPSPRGHRGRQLCRSTGIRIEMIKHIVMWNIRGETADEKRASALFVKSRFETLIGVIPGLTGLEVGLDTSGVDYACDVVLYTEFTDQQALENYATHPEHLRVKQEIGDLRISRYQVDYPGDVAETVKRAI